MGIFKFKGQYEFLALDYPAPVKVKGYTYDNAKRAFAAIRFTDEEMLQMCITCDDKTLNYVIGTLNRGPFIEGDFALRVQDYLMIVIEEKFKDKHLRDLLLATGDEKIIYLDKDIVLGVHKRQGSNLLGKCLMKVREEVNNENHSDKKSTDKNKDRVKTIEELFEDFEI